MQRKRGELVPVAEVIADLPGPIQATRKTPPPAQRGFTVADQVNQLVEASEADPERGFMDGSGPIRGATLFTRGKGEAGFRSWQEQCSRPLCR